jgi:hypothetical protein
MNIRVLSIDEMTELQDGAHAILVKHVEDLPELPIGTILVRNSDVMDDRHSVSFKHSVSQYDYFEDGEVGVYVFPQKEQTARPAEELGVYRPELATRKIGKTRVELVDDGFPLALREVAQVMTWAQTAKGYKDHDWQNLPDAEVALAAAASRHRTDHIKQRVVEGFDIKDCVDPESALLHKAHEAFGVLAQLELMLRGKFAEVVDSNV